MVNLCQGAGRILGINETAGIWDGHSNQSHVDDSVQVCRNPIANALELLQSCTKPAINGYFMGIFPSLEILYSVGVDFTGWKKLIVNFYA